jgi:hypothetical protein
MMLGLEIDMPIEKAVARLTERGVKVGGIVRDSPGNFTHFEDPDGNPIYLWELKREEVTESELAHSGASTQK